MYVVEEINSFQSFLKAAFGFLDSKAASVSVSMIYQKSFQFLRRTSYQSPKMSSQLIVFFFVELYIILLFSKNKIFFGEIKNKIFYVTNQNVIMELNIKLILIVKKRVA